MPSEVSRHVSANLSTQIRATLIYVTSRNITLNLPADLLRKAKVHAAEHDTTINSFVRDLLQLALSRDTAAETAVERLIDLADQGPWFTADPGSIAREDLHERR